MFVIWLMFRPLHKKSYPYSPTFRSDMFCPFRERIKGIELRDCECKPSPFIFHVHWPAGNCLKQETQGLIKVLVEPAALCLIFFNSHLVTHARSFLVSSCFCFEFYVLTSSLIFIDEKTNKNYGKCQPSKYVHMSVNNFRVKKIRQ